MYSSLCPFLFLNNTILIQDLNTTFIYFNCVWWDAACTVVFSLVLTFNKVQCHNSCSEEENKTKLRFSFVLFFFKLISFLKELSQIGLILLMIHAKLRHRETSKSSCSNEIDFCSSFMSWSRSRWFRLKKEVLKFPTQPKQLLQLFSSWSLHQRQVVPDWVKQARNQVNNSILYI